MAAHMHVRRGAMLRDSGLSHGVVAVLRGLPHAFPPFVGARPLRSVEIRETIVQHDTVGSKADCSWRGWRGVVPRPVSCYKEEQGVQTRGGIERSI